MLQVISDRPPVTSLENRTMGTLALCREIILWQPMAKFLNWNDKLYTISLSNSSVLLSIWLRL